MGSVEEANRAFVIRHFADWDQALASGDFDAVADYFAPDFVSHSHPRRSSGAPVVGLDGWRAAFDEARRAFGERQHHVAWQIAEDDLVMSYLDVRLKHTGEFLGVAPTFKEANLGQIIIFRVRENKLVESWSEANMLSLLTQLGVSPSSIGQA